MMNASSLEQLSWPISCAGDCLATLALAAQKRLRMGSAERDQPVPFSAGRDFQKYLDEQAHRLGCEVERIETTLRDLKDHLRAGSPTILQVSDHSIVAIRSVRGRYCSVLLPRGSIIRIRVSDFCETLRESAGERSAESLASLLDTCGITGARRTKMLRTLLDEQLGHRPFDGCWKLRAAAGAPMFDWLRQAGAIQVSAGLLCAHSGQYLLSLAAWGLLGSMSLHGRMDRGWLVGWALLLMTLVPFRLATTALQGRLAIGLGALLKRRLLAGALKLRADEVRHSGTGTFLGQALEAEAVETLALGGGIAALLACLELLFSGFVLGRFSILLAAWCGIALLSAWRFLRRYRAWTDTRMHLTQDVIENMVGHRTRLAQQRPHEWHSLEDENLNGYFAYSKEVDWAGSWLIGAIPRGWLVIGILALAPGVVLKNNSSTDTAVVLGGILLAFSGFRRLASSFSEIAAAWVASERIANLFWAAARPEMSGAPFKESGNRAGDCKVIEADQLTFKYPGSERTTIEGCNVSIWHGERILLEGPSGGGKTTLAALLSGLRQPNSGSLLANGIDLKSLGARRWRERVVSAPQFHENYIFTESLAFNLLMGRKWPPGPKDFQAADALCRELGLGELLDRMPSGLLQMVGEGGWQLSHGERSRIFIARALLQKSDLVILDESFGALDPESLQKSMECTLNHAETLLVIAHP